MRKAIPLSYLCLLFVLPLSLTAQLEIGIMGGMSHYKGDLSPGKFFKSIGQGGPAAGAFLRYGINPYATVRLHGFYGRISADDNDAATAEQRARNLSFRSNVLEIGLVGEWNILGYQAYNFAAPISPYLFSGITFFNYDPETFYEGSYVALQPLGTEGQGLAAYPDREPYKLSQFAVPVGVGIKYALTDKINIGLEVGARITFDDYLDDVSTTYVNAADLQSEAAQILFDRSVEGREAGSGRGDASNNDLYWFSGVTVSYNISDNGLVGSRGRNRRRQGCQTF